MHLHHICRTDSTVTVLMEHLLASRPQLLLLIKVSCPVCNHRMMVLDHHSSTFCSHPNKRSCLKSPSCSPRLFITTLLLCSILFILPLVQQQDFLSAAIGRKKPWPLMERFGLIVQSTVQSIKYSGKNDMASRDAELESMAEKLRDSVTFHPLKDLCYANKALEGHTWFMSTMDDTHIKGEAQHQHFPSEASQGRVLCLKGNDSHDGSRNYYALAWLGFLPKNATFMKGLTIVSNNHYSYNNIWHGLSAVLPFVGWHQKNGCRRPDRWVLYHQGEIQARMATWLELMMGATFGGPPTIDAFDGVDDGGLVCFEEAVVMRHNEGEMSRQRRMEVYDLIRCKARSYCNVSTEGRPVMGMTMLMRTGARSFRDNVAVIEIFQKECAKFEDCRLTVAYSNNLTVCEQVELMSRTDILVSPHGAQLTNIFLMDRNSSVMEFFPKGWLKLAGVGQYVYHWMASWSGMRHQGAWRDPNGDPCPQPEDDRLCMHFYKSAKIGHNQTYFAEWARKVLNEAVSTKAESALHETDASSSAACSCR